MIPGQASAAHLMAHLVVTVIAALLPHGVAGSCSVVRYAMDLRSCFRMRQMGADVMIHSKDTIVETSLQSEGFLGDPHTVCREKEKFFTLFDCLEGTTSKCVSNDDEKNYLPDAALTKHGLEYFCYHVNDIDDGCYNQTYSEVFDCVHQLSLQNLRSNDTASTRACITVDITHDCIHEHVACHDPTRDLLLKFQDEYRKPKGCPAPTRSNRKKYITSTGSSMAAFVSKLFCIGLSFCLILLHTD